MVEQAEQVEQTEQVRLRYVGDGSFFRNVPARDLTVWEVEERFLDAGALAATALYELVKAPAPGKGRRPRVEKTSN